MGAKSCFKTASLLLLFFSAAFSQQESIVERAQYAVVKLHALSGENNSKEEYGSGFIVGSTANSLLVLTSRHVVGRKISTGRWHRADKVWFTPYGQVEELAVENKDILLFPDDGDDLAIVVVDRRQVNNFEALTLSKRFQYGGTTVTALTYPVEETKPRITTGIIEALDGEYYDVRFEITGRPFKGGESGSPVLNERMLVVGIVTQRFATQEGNTNQILNSLRIRSFLRRLNIEPLPSPENQRLALMPILFEPQNKQQKWSKDFIKHLEDFLFQLPEVSTISGQALNNILPYVVNPQAGYSLSAEELYMLPSYVVRGSGRKDGKDFILDLYLRILPGEQVVWNGQVRAKKIHNLADSAGVRIARFFEYQTKFKGVPNDLRIWSFRIAVAGLVATPFLVSAVSSSQSAYEAAITGAAAESEFNTLRRNEILRNSAVIITTASIGSWFNAKFINPRRPEFVKKEVNYLAKEQ